MNLLIYKKWGKQIVIILFQIVGTSKLTREGKETFHLRQTDKERE